jgi:hypothetical protein
VANTIAMVQAVEPATTQQQGRAQHGDAGEQEAQ